MSWHQDATYWGLSEPDVVTAWVAFTESTPANGNGGVVYKLASVRLTARLNGNELDLSWPVAGPHLQAQANSPGVGINTNWFNVPSSTGTNHVVVPINPGNGSAFFRLFFQ